MEAKGSEVRVCHCQHSHAGFDVFMTQPPTITVKKYRDVMNYNDSRKSPHSRFRYCAFQSLHNIPSAHRYEKLWLPYLMTFMSLWQMDPLPLFSAISSTFWCFLRCRHCCRSEVVGILIGRSLQSPRKSTQPFSNSLFFGFCRSFFAFQILDPALGQTKKQIALAIFGGFDLSHWNCWQYTKAQITQPLLFLIFE